MLNDPALPTPKGGPRELELGPRSPVATPLSRLRVVQAPSVEKLSLCIHPYTYLLPAQVPISGVIRVIKTVTRCQTHLQLAGPKQCPTPAAVQDIPTQWSPSSL